MTFTFTFLPFNHQAFVTRNSVIFVQFESYCLTASRQNFYTVILEKRENLPF